MGDDKNSNELPANGENKSSFANGTYSHIKNEDETNHKIIAPRKNGSSPGYSNGIHFIAYKNQHVIEERNEDKGVESLDEFDMASEIESDADSVLNRPTPTATLAPQNLKRSHLYGSTRRTTRRFSLVPRRGSTWSTIYEEDEGHRELILKIRKNLPLKDFAEEIRARKDLANFLVQPVVLLDVNDTSLENIIQKLMQKMRKDLEIDEKLPGNPRKWFFTHGSPGNESLASVDQLRETIQGVKYVPDGTEYEQTWLTALCALPNVKKSHVSIARLRHPLNLGNKFEEISFVIAVVAPRKEKFTKNAVEVGRTFSTMMSNIQFRKGLTDATSEEEFRQVLKDQSESFMQEASEALTRTFNEPDEEIFDDEFPFWHCGKGVVADLKRRIPLYPSDIRDGLVGKDTIRKVISTTLFLYFACILPDIAFGTVYEESTYGKINVVSCILAQTLGGLMFSLLGGQPLMVVMTTAPVALFVKVVYSMAEIIDTDFLAFYAMVGIWNSIFIILQGLFHASKLMKYSTRSTEEVFEFFVALAFCADAVKSTTLNYDKNYNFNKSVPINDSLDLPKKCYNEDYCTRPENFVLFLFLMFGTFALGLMILHFKQSQFLSAVKREILSDYALPLAVIAFSLIGTLAFRDVVLTPFTFFEESLGFNLAPFEKLRLDAVFIAAGLGFSLSCLFFVEQNIAAVLVNNPANKLEKGPAYHWDLILIAIINGILSIFNLPWVHGALPHSPLHVRALADVEQHVTALGAVHDNIVRVRETRLTGIVSNILIGLSLLMVNVLQGIPVAVLQGIFLYLAITSFSGNQMFERLLLFFTEGSSYPPNHYVRKVPQSKLYLFTICQIVMLALVALFGLSPWPYLKMAFPLVILLLLPIRHKLLTLIIEPKYLHILDSH